MLLFELNSITTKNIDISQLVNIVEKSQIPVYILVSGSVGSGKSFLVNKYLPNIDVVDPDIININMSKNDKYDRKNVAKSINMVKKVVKEKLDKKQTFLQQGTAANLQSSINKLKTAKEKGFLTIFLYVSTSIEQALKQVKKRIELGGHGDTIDKTKIENTFKGAQRTFRTLSGVDFNNLTEPDLEKIEEILIKNKQTLKQIRQYLDYFIEIKNNY